MQPEQWIKNDRGKKSKQRVNTHLHGGIGNHRHKSPAHAEVRTESLREVRIERARVDHMPAHRRVANAENQQNHPRDHERTWNPGAIAQLDINRNNPQHSGQRGGSGDDKKHNLPHADRIFLEFRRTPCHVSSCAPPPIFVIAIHATLLITYANGHVAAASRAPFQKTAGD